MRSIALIGPDGAGKTTLSRMLQQSPVLRLKYIYMGIEIRKSNITLPTSRWIERVKERGSRRDAKSRDDASGPARRGIGAAAWAAARLTNRLAEEWFRQTASWYYQVRGFTVLYDRHFVFDFAPEVAGHPREPLDKRIHRWCISTFYPRPDLTVFLDAPGTLLFARKGELSASELERRRQAFLQVGQRIPGFVRVDATRRVDIVYAEIVRHVEALSRGSGRGRSRAAEGG
jgi:thymidylate kinase